MRPCLREERALQPEREGGRLQKAGLVRGEQVAGEEERGAARLRGSGELRGGSFLPRYPWCLQGATPIQSTAGVSRVLFRVGEAFPGEAEKTHWTEVTRGSCFSPRSHHHVTLSAPTQGAGPTKQ